MGILVLNFGEYSLLFSFPFLIFTWYFLKANANTFTLNKQFKIYFLYELWSFFLVGWLLIRNESYIKTITSVAEQHTWWSMWLFPRSSSWSEQWNLLVWTVEVNRNNSCGKMEDRFLGAMQTPQISGISLHFDYTHLLKVLHSVVRKPHSIHAVLFFTLSCRKLRFFPPSPLSFKQIWLNQCLPHLRQIKDSDSASHLAFSHLTHFFIILFSL